MFAFILKRLAALLPTLLGITLVSFGLIRLIPGDPIEVMMGERSLEPEAHAALVKQMGLDQSLPAQYWDYVSKLAQGDLGQSLVSRESVASEFATLFPATVELAVAALLMAVTLGLLLGVLAGLKRGSWLDQGVMGVATVGYSMPVFWWGLILIMFFSVQMSWTPISGRIGIEFEVVPISGFMLFDAWVSEEAGAFRSACLHLLLPALVLGTSTMAVVARMTRSSMLEVLREDYIRAARAKGLSPARVIFVHALRNALIPVLTVIGMQAGSLLAGAVLTETIFSWPGIGKWLIDSIARRDYPVVQAGILISALSFILVNLGVDLLYGVLNPRIRASH
ncbi:ABC transporter permease subunit [Paucibacter sp. TC2R-5]|uniref:ABC transporter permease n=1 Tax=Paucibacter sp. TC2R-5 TaxID=2893555 RepID=UPI0021E51318|nr:ABC transporter permease subunit [Paucibacter sp. TC2R-5]MCV2360248.1 ABC transporter permease subunit [Paucibacter sp. TC2R-5]